MHGCCEYADIPILFPYSKNTNYYLYFATSHGMIKRPAQFTWSTKDRMGLCKIQVRAREAVLLSLTLAVLLSIKWSTAWKCAWCCWESAFGSEAARMPPENCSRVAWETFSPNALQTFCGSDYERMWQIKTNSSLESNLIYLNLANTKQYCRMDVSKISTQCQDVCHRSDDAF